MRMRIAALAFAMGLVGCGGQIGPVPQASYGEPEGAAAESEADDSSFESIWREQKLIRNGDIEIEVADANASAQAVGAIAARHDGIVADSRTSRYSTGQLHASITLRVPAGAFDATFAELRGLGSVTREGISTKDVTKAYFDLETRLAVKRGAAERIREILAKRTGTLADVIAAESELSRLTEEIEGLEGEKRFYDHRIATSTIQISLTEPEGVVLSLIDPVGQAFRDSGRVLGQSIQAMVLLVTVALPWVVAALLGWLFVRKARRWLRSG